MFAVGLLALLGLDLALTQRTPHAPSVREALLETLGWVTVASLFGLGVFHFYGAEAGLQFATGYVLEKALSVDNLFVMLVVMRAFAVPASQQHRVLFWGVLGAVVLRSVFVFAGAALVARFHSVLLLFGVFLVVTGLRLALQKDHEVHPENNIAVRLLKRFMPVSTDPHASTFFVWREGVRHVTPLLLALITVEVTDVIFAVDSIPAVFAVTQDPFLVLTSNLFAVMGLRALYFVLAEVMQRFVFLKYGLAAVLVFVGGKMLLAPWLAVPVGLSLGVIVALLAVSMVASALWSRSQRNEARAHSLSSVE